jgi:hypothetical protein
MHRVEHLLMRTPHAWRPHNERTRQLVNDFLLRLGTHTMGVSCGGFVVVTRPFILSVASFVITYLILLYQFTTDRRHDIGH